MGNGAREHIVCESLVNSGAKVFSFMSAKNPGIVKLSEDFKIGALSDFRAILEFAKLHNVDFAFIGPDNPIGDGLSDALLEGGIDSVAPLKTVARLESSKSFTRQLLLDYGIKGNPKFRVFYSEDGVLEFLKELGEDFVVKADGLMGGKGVKVSGVHLKDYDEALSYVRECLDSGSKKVVIEEKFIGQEFSLMSFSDGVSIAPMPAVQDHKLAYEGDKGPNTGGMGTYSDVNHLLPFLRQQDVDEALDITRKVQKALFDETGVLFKGIMYGGFIATKNGVKLIEFNARFGDPEAMNVLPLLKTNFVDLCLAIIDGKLSEIDVEFMNKATVCKYVVPEGYPTHPLKGEKVFIGDVPKEARMYFASVDERDDGIYMSGSRAIAFVGVADSISEAEKIAENACENVSGKVFFRKDIGTDELISKRVEFMKNLRGM